MYLVINLGLKSIRGIIFEESGDQLYSKTFPVHTSLFSDRVEQDADEWIDLLTQILKDIHTNTDLSHQIKFITATTSSSCIFGVDQNLQAVTKVLMVSDKRAGEEVNCIDEIIRNGNFNSEVLCASSSLVPKALWFKKHEPETYSKVKFWLGAGEIINYFFTSEIFTDPLNAGKAFYNGRGYEAKLLEAIGISTNSLPKVRELGSKTSIDKKIIEKFDLHQNCKFILTTYDAICAVIGSNNGEENNACDVSGTVTSVRMLTEREISPANNQETLLCQPLKFLGKNLLGASNNLGGGIIEWYKQALFKDETDDVYFSMENYARQASVGAGGVIFLPYLLGERAPEKLPNASGTFFGLDRSSSIKDLTRAVFESTAYVTRDLLELIEDSGENIHSITVSGGLARFDLINQIKADVCNKPVNVVENFESTSVGAFILMAMANSVFNNLQEALQAVVKVRKVILPSSKNVYYYNECFQLFKNLNKNLIPIYDEHVKLKSKKTRHEVEIVRNL